MSQTSKVSKNNTNIRIKDGFTIIRLYNTDIVKFNSEVIILNTDGYKTVTTKTRMAQVRNQYNLNYYVFQEKRGTVTVFLNHREQSIKKGGQRAAFLIV